MRDEFRQRADLPSDGRLDWWRRTSLGLFIHWGLYALDQGPLLERYPPQVTHHWTSEWLQQVCRIPRLDYRRLAEAWAAPAFSGEAWTLAARLLGAEYMVLTAKHHDGFCLFCTATTDFNAVEATPLGRDVVAEYVAAVRRHGLRVGLYFSQTQDWWQPDGHGNDWDFAPAGKDFERYFETVALRQVEELLTGYGPIDLLWLDTPMVMTREQAERLRDQIYRLQPNCIVNGRIGHGLGDYASLRDNRFPDGRVALDWEACLTTNHSWGFRASDQNWRDPAEVARRYREVRAQGGHLLLNVGPDADGLIPVPAIDLLAEVGRLRDPA